MSHTDPEDEPLRLASADNFRDVAGPGYPTADGGRMRRGVVYRSNELQLSDDEVVLLHRRGFGTLWDLRGADEVAAHRDSVVPGTRWVHLPVGGIPMDRVSDLAEAGEALAVMHEVYRAFVEDPTARAAYAQLLSQVAEHHPPGVFHCTAGKDRTGWAAAMLQHLAGVADDVILADYLLSNEASATRDKYLAMIREHLGEEKVAVYEAVMVVDASYLQAGYDAVTAAYGDRATYLREGLGLSDDTLVALRDRLRA